jgi:hypothetical protein
MAGARGKATISSNAKSNADFRFILINTLFFVLPTYRLLADTPGTGRHPATAIFA